MNRIYLDSCIIIYIVEKHPVYSSRIEKLLNSLPLTDYRYSPLTRLECLVMPFRTKDFRLKNLYESFFNAQTICLIPPLVFDQVVKLRADFTALKTPDALHLATAVSHNCGEFWTNDNRLDKIYPNLVKNILTP